MIAKKILLGAFIAVGTLSVQADVVTVSPYIVDMSYANSALKEDGKAFGLYASKGDLSYLLEGAIGKTAISYKDKTIEDLSQEDITLIYSKYGESMAYKGGLHYTNTNDTVLGDSIVAIVGVQRYTFDDYDKFFYGMDGFVSYYKDGHDDKLNEKAITVYQASPYIGLSKAINIDTKDIFTLKLNYNNIPQYDTQSYSSIAFINTLYYKKLYTTIKGYTGKQKNLVDDGGFSVYNLKDEYKRGGSAEVGYFITSGLSANVGYSKNDYKEDGGADTSNSVAFFAVKYSY